MRRIFLLWKSGCITSHTPQEAQAMAENAVLAPSIVKAGYSIAEL